MTEILQQRMPEDLVADAALPGVRPLADGRWLRVDEAYAAQMSYRRHLIATRRAEVLWQEPAAEEAAEELYEAASELLAASGFDFAAEYVGCPDGASIAHDPESRLATLGCAVQEDLCIMQKRGAEHVLTAAVLCFPASWTLAEKAGRPLSTIHGPVENYDATMAIRVQRMFDGVRAGRPIWRNNMLRYSDPDLHQPRSEHGDRRAEPASGAGRYLRAERQCILRLPRTQAVVFSIHSYVVRADT